MIHISYKTLPKKVIFLALSVFFVSRVIIAVRKLENKESDIIHFRHLIVFVSMYKCPHPLFLTCGFKEQKMNEESMKN